VVQEGIPGRRADDRIEQWLLPRLAIRSPPWTIHRAKADHLYLRPAAECKPIVYGKPDNVITFDRLSSVFVSNTNHAEDQPPHLTLKDPPFRCRSTSPATPARKPILPRRRLRVRRRQRHRAAADQRAELRPLQDLRHQGPDPEHRLGAARGRRGPDLRRHVKETSMENPPIEVLTAARLWPPMMESLRGRFQVHDRNHQSDAAAFAAAAPRIRAIAASGESKVPRELIAQMPALEIVSVFGVGYDGVDVAAARASAASP
jgi:hypothetical protein